MSKGKMPDGMRTALYWVVGLGSIALVILIMLILFGNLQGNLGFTDDSHAFARITINFNSSGGTFADTAGKVNPTISGLAIVNATGGETIPKSNYSVSGATITAVATSPWNNTNVNISGTLTYDSQEQIDSDYLINNYSKSGTNTASQLPTTGTIVGVSILLGVLIAVLIFAVRRLMNVSTSGSSGMSLGSNRRFRGSSNSGIA